MYSEIALKVFSLVYNKKIKSYYQFWKNFSCLNDLYKLQIDTIESKKFLDSKEYDILCAFDEDFPTISQDIKKSERPFLFAYKGNIQLLKEINNNVAIVGVLNPTEEIVLREKQVVKAFVDKGFNIVSGLAKGCDTIAHIETIENKGKTIAILPTDLENIYPKENSNLVNEIVKNNGLVITEYFFKPSNRFEGIKRFIERDRLQAMFANKIVLIASFIKGKGDCGSKYAMSKAKEYKRLRFAMFNEKTDIGKDIFELNEIEISNGAKILTKADI